MRDTLLKEWNMDEAIAAHSVGHPSCRANVSGVPRARMRNASVTGKV